MFPFALFWDRDHHKRCLLMRLVVLTEDHSVRQTHQRLCLFVLLNLFVSLSLPPSLSPSVWVSSCLRFRKPLDCDRIVVHAFCTGHCVSSLRTNQLSEEHVESKQTLARIKAERLARILHLETHLSGKGTTISILATISDLLRYDVSLVIVVWITQYSNNREYCA